jgi:hypothetical protein
MFPMVLICRFLPAFPLVTPLLIPLSRAEAE